MKYSVVVLIFQVLFLLGFTGPGSAKTAQNAAARSEGGACPQNISENDCDAFRSGYADAREDHKIMGLVESGNWKDDTNDPPAYKAGYEAGWKSK